MASAMQKRRKTPLSFPNLSAAQTALDNLSSMWDEVDSVEREMSANALPKRPPGVFSQREFAEQRKIPMNTAHNRLVAGVANGRYERIRAYAVDVAGRRTPQWFYRVVK